MPFKLKKVSKYINKKINNKKNYFFPKNELTGSPNFYFGLISGVRGAGKSVSLLNILSIEKNNMLKNDSMVYFISPTQDAKIVDFLERYPDNTEYFDELNMKVFNQVIDKINTRITEWKQTKYIFDLLEKYLQDEKNIDDTELNILVESGILDDGVDIKDIIKNFEHRHPPISCICIDDSLGSPLISSSNSKQGKEFTRFAIRNRHSYCHMFILTQHYRGISKNLRTNSNLILLFPSKDRSILKSIFDEFSSLFGGKIENYYEALDLLDKNPYSFLYMWYDDYKELRHNFDKRITFDE
jgi:hypothetical protein